MARGALDLGMEDMLPDVVAAAEEADLWERALRLLVVLGPDLHRRLAPLVPMLSADQRAEALARAREWPAWTSSGPLGDAPGDGARGSDPALPARRGARPPEIEETRTRRLRSAPRRQSLRGCAAGLTPRGLALCAWVRVSAVN